MTTQTPQWLAISQEDVELKGAFQGALEYGLQKADSSFEPTWFYDLQLYVYTGIKFPPTEAVFERDLPAAQFAELSNIDPEVYPFTKKTIIGISKSCNAFKDDWLGRIVLSANAAISYADEAIGMLREEEGINFQAQIEVLLSPNCSMASNTYKVALEGAQMALEHLKEQAAEKKEETASIVGALKAFELDTQRYYEDVQTLRELYSSGPVTNLKTKTVMPQQKPYSKFLNSKVSDLMDTINKNLEEQDGRRKAWEGFTVGAIVCSFCPIIGWVPAIALGVVAHANDLAYDKLLLAIRESREKSRGITDLLCIVNQLIHQFKTLAEKMAKAVKALSALQSVFSEQELHYASIIGSLAQCRKGVGAKELAGRKLWVSNGIDRAVGNLRKLKANAITFQQSGRLNIPAGRGQ